MYRSRKTKQNAATAQNVNVNNVIPSNVTESLEVPISQSIMNFKSRLMAPFMLFDKTIRQVVLNPLHDRVLRSEISRVQGTVLRELRHALERESILTPKQALYAVQKSIMLAYASCAVLNDTEALIPLSSDEETVNFMPRLESYFAERNASAKAVASLAAVLSTGIVRDTYGEVCKRLEARIAAEDQSHFNKQRSKESQLALMATKKNIEDFIQLRSALITAFDAISTPFNENNITTQGNSVITDVTTVDLTIQSYFNLLGWTLMLQPERLSLENSRNNLSISHKQEEKEELFAKVTFYDPINGKITIERSSPSSKWGLMLNASGSLIGLENVLRTSTKAGGILYQAIQQEETGLKIFNINGNNIRSSKNNLTEKEETDEAKASRWETIRQVLQGQDSVVNLIVSKQTQLNEPQEVSFNIMSQGGEDASGQQAVLILKRPSTEVQWQLKLRNLAGDILILEEISKSLQLSKAAKKFFSSHHGNLLITNVNGCDTSYNSLFMDLFQSSLYLVLHFRVVDDMDRLIAASTSKESENLAEKTPAFDKKNFPAKETPKHELENTEEVEEAQHRALLEENNIDPDEPLPEIEFKKVEESSSSKKRRGRPKREMVQEETVEEIPTLNEPKELPIEATTEVEESSSSKKRRGRPKREMVQKETVEEIPTLNEPEELPIEATTEVEESSSSKKRRGRPKKEVLSTEIVDAVEESNVQLQEGQELPKEVSNMEELSSKKENETVTMSKKETQKAKKEAQKAKKEAQKAKKEAQKAKKKAKEETQSKKKNKGNSVKEQNEEEVSTEEAGKTLEEIANSQGVLDKPLINIKSQSELVEEVNKEKKSKKDALLSSQPESPSTVFTEAIGGGANHVIISGDLPVSVEELKDAPPLTFENAVTLDRFDGSHMELRRPDLKTPWNMKVSLGGDKLVLTRLPPISAALKTHPFLKSLQPDIDGNISWRVDGVNGTDLTTATKAIRTKALEAIKKTNKVSFILRRIAK